MGTITECRKFLPSCKKKKRTKKRKIRRTEPSKVDMIDELDLRRIRDAANVVDVIGDYVQLKNVGSEYQCL